LTITVADAVALHTPPIAVSVTETVAFPVWIQRTLMKFDPGGAPPMFTQFASGVMFHTKLLPGTAGVEYVCSVLIHTTFGPPTAGVGVRLTATLVVVPVTFPKLLRVIVNDWLPWFCH
jgi:hypothetical protein